MSLLRMLLLLSFLIGIRQDALAQQRINDRRAMVASGFVRIAVPEGDVRVVGWDRDSLAVSGTVPQGSAVEITRQGARVGAWNDAAPGRGEYHITVHVPAHSQLWIKTAGANTTVTNMLGGLDIFSVTGNIRISGQPRELYAESMAGTIELANVKTSLARAKTASGTIDAKGDVADITAVSVSGDIIATLTSFGRARFESVEGAIRYTGDVPAGAVMDVVNHAGSISLAVPPQTAADFSFNLYQSELQDEFGIRKRWMMANKAGTREMTFGVGDRPSARVTIRSFKGPVSIRKLDSR